MRDQIKARLEEIMAGEAAPDRMVGSTTVRIAVGLILDELDATNPTMALTPAEALLWLDDVQRRAITEFREYGPRWAQMKRAAQAQRA
ncbi:hypothetical protein [Azorhizobium doebereinerae]|uniref:hypothetical protein n=1 Tax=Azorhizobium doebereinerae TaxID=281091 RepID=UPI00048ED594|nr:hypothetical protein [Azorhizobium doebereinerae]